MSRRYPALQEVDSLDGFLEGGIDGLDELDAFITRESLKHMGIASGIGLGSGVTWAFAMQKIPDFGSGKMAMLKSLLPAVVGAVGGYLLYDKNLPAAAAVAASGATLSGAFLASDLLLKQGGTVSYRQIAAVTSAAPAPAAGTALTDLMYSMDDDDLFGLDYIDSITEEGDFGEFDVEEEGDFGDMDVEEESEFGDDLFDDDDSFGDYDDDDWSA